MNSSHPETFILSLGGSLIAPDEINGAFLRSFYDLLSAKTPRLRFFIICGGGKTARRYQEGLRQADFDTPADLDQMGIDASYLNARFVQRIFGSLAAPQIMTDPMIQQDVTEPIVVGAGWKPGHSTDLVAAQCAITNNVTTVINLSNVAAVYDKDPQEYSDAVAQKNMSWDDFIKLVGTTWEPGMNTPFDPAAARLAADHGLRVIVALGSDLQNLEALLDRLPFIGTTIS